MYLIFPSTYGSHLDTRSHRIQRDSNQQPFDREANALPSEPPCFGELPKYYCLKCPLMFVIPIDYGKEQVFNQTFLKFTTRRSRALNPECRIAYKAVWPNLYPPTWVSNLCQCLKRLFVAICMHNSTYLCIHIPHNCANFV